MEPSSHVSAQLGDISLDLAEPALDGIPESAQPFEYRFYSRFRIHLVRHRVLPAISSRTRQTTNKIPYRASDPQPCEASSLQDWSTLHPRLVVWRQHRSAFRTL